MTKEDTDVTAAELVEGIIAVEAIEVEQVDVSFNRMLSFVVTDAVMFPKGIIEGTTDDVEVVVVVVVGELVEGAALRFKGEVTVARGELLEVFNRRPD